MRRTSGPTGEATGPATNRPTGEATGPATGDATSGAIGEATGAGPDRAPAEGRSARKRRDIMAAATTLFLRNGYQGTSMDDIAAMAAVSKQTVYKNFADKDGLFTEIILGTLDRATEPFLAEVRALAATEDLPAALLALGRRYLESVMRPEVMQLRRLIIGEATRQPELARTYYERAPQRTLALLGECFARLAERGLLARTDPRAAAGHFAYLVLGEQMDKAMFFAGQTVAPRTLHAHADAGVTAFLRAYGPGTG